MQNIAKLKIIIIDDDPSINLLLKTTLEKQGHEVLTFSDPTVCLASRSQNDNCQRSTPCSDIIISDIVMPHMSGIELFKHQVAKCCKIPATNKALISATTDQEHFNEINELGYKFFKKPFKLSEILRWIEECSESSLANNCLARSA